MRQAEELVAGEARGSGYGLWLWLLPGKRDYVIPSSLFRLSKLPRHLSSHPTHPHSHATIGSSPETPTALSQKFLRGCASDRYRSSIARSSRLQDQISPATHGHIHLQPSGTGALGCGSPGYS